MSRILDHIRNSDTLSCNCGGRFQIPVTVLRIVSLVGVIFFMIGLALLPLSYKFSFPHSVKMCCTFSLCFGGLAAFLGVLGLDHIFKFLYNRKLEKLKITSTWVERNGLSKKKILEG